MNYVAKEKNNDLIEGVSYYLISPLFLAEDYLGTFQLSEKSIRAIINAYNTRWELINFISTKEIIKSVNQIEPQKQFIAKEIIDVIKQKDISHIMVLDPDYAYLKKQKLFSFVSDREYRLKVSLKINLDDGTEQAFIFKGTFFFYLLVHTAGSAVLSLIASLDNYKNHAGDFGDFLLFSRYLLYGKNADPFEFTIYFRSIVKKVLGLPENAKIKKLDVKYYIEFEIDGETEIMDNIPPAEFLGLISGILQEESERKIKEFVDKKPALKMFKYLQMLSKREDKEKNHDKLKKGKRDKKNLLKESNTGGSRIEPIIIFDYIHIKLNHEKSDEKSTKAIKDTVFRKLSASEIYNQPIKKDTMKHFIVEDPRDHIDLYHFSSTILEFDAREFDPLMAISRYFSKFGDFPVFLMLNIIAILFLVFRKFDEMIETSFRIDMGKGSAEKSLYQTILSQRAFLAVTAEYNNIRFIGPEPYDLLYDNLKKSFKLHEYFNTITGKLEMLGAVKQREHYVTLKRHEGSKKKLFLVVQVFAFLITVFNVLNLIIHTWHMLSFPAVLFEVLFYIGTIEFVVSLSLFLFVSMDKYVQLTQYFKSDKKPKLMFIGTWIAFLLSGGILTYYNPVTGPYLYTFTGFVTLVLWYIDFILINKKVDEFQRYLETNTQL